MLPNPFQKSLPEFKDTDPLKNREIVRSLLGEHGVHRYRKILSGNTDSSNKREKNVSQEDLKALAADARSKIDTLSRDSFKLIFEKLIEKGYKSQIKSLQEINFLETKDGKIGHVDILGVFRELPTEEAIKNHFLSLPNIRQKIAQGFTRLLIVPFGSSIENLLCKTGELILKHSAVKKLLSEDGTVLSVDMEEPAYMFDDYHEREDSSEIVYYPTSFDLNNEGGKTKAELLSKVSKYSPFPGYHVLLISEDTQLSRLHEGEEQAGRSQLESNMSSIEYLGLLNSDPAYAGEFGLTPEDWLTLFSTKLNQTNRVIGDYESDQDCMSFLIGSTFLAGNGVPLVVWDRTRGRVNLTTHSPSCADLEISAHVAIG